MAEVLGVIASGIAVGQLAGEVTKSIVKLKGYWDQVRDAPDEIRHLLLEIDSLTVILCHIQDDLETPGAPSGSVRIQQSLKFCKEGTDELSALVNDLSKTIERKAWLRKKSSAVKVVLKKEDIKRLKRRMKNAIRLLSLAYQCHTNAMIQRQPDIILARIETTMTSMISATPIAKQTAGEVSEMTSELQGMTRSRNKPRKLEEHSLITKQYQSWISSPPWIRFLLGSLEYLKRCETQNHQQRIEVSVKYDCPTWLYGRAWKARYTYETHSGWQFHMKTHLVLPWDHDVFQLVRAEDAAGLQNILAIKPGYLASTTGNGDTLLHSALQRGKFAIAKLLLTAGADPSATNRLNCNPLQELASFRSQTPEQKRMSMDLCRLLINAGGSDSNPLIQFVDTDARSTIFSIHWFRGTKSMFEFFQQQMYLSYPNLSIRDRLETLHSICYAKMASAYVDYFPAGGNFSKRMHLLYRAVQTWLSDLQTSGVNLRQYGEVEQSLKLKGA